MGDIVVFLKEIFLRAKKEVEVVDFIMWLRKKKVLDLVLFSGLPFHLLGDFGSKTLLVFSHFYIWT